MKVIAILILIGSCLPISGQSLKFHAKLLPNSYPKLIIIQQSENSDIRKRFYDSTGVIDSIVLLVSSLPRSSFKVIKNPDGSKIEKSYSYSEGILKSIYIKYFDSSEFLFRQEIRKNIVSKHEIYKTIEYNKNKFNMVECKFSKGFSSGDSSVLISVEKYEYEFDTLLHKKVYYSQRRSSDSLAYLTLSCIDTSAIEGKVMWHQKNSILNDTIYSEIKTSGKSSLFQSYYKRGTHVFDKMEGSQGPGHYFTNIEISSDNSYVSQSIATIQEGSILKSKITQFREESIKGYASYALNDITGKYIKNIILNFSYVYDHKGNWIKRISTSASGETETLERIITYY